MRAFAAAALLAVTAACAPPRYLARVNDETITGKELRGEFARHHVALEKSLANDADIRKYVDRLVDRRLFVQEGYRLKLEDAPDVREAVARVRSNKLIDLFRQEEIEATTKVSDDEVKAVWEGLAEQLEVRQVVVATREEAGRIAAAIAGGADLEKLARERSIADSAKQGGMLLVGWGLDEAYEKVLFPLPERAVSPVFRSQAGWEVARVEKRKAIEKAPPLEKVSGKIRQILQKRRRLAREEEVYSALWAKYDAKLEPCVPDVEALRAAAAANDQTACATWRGGKVTAAALAGRVKLDQLGAVGPKWPEMRKLLVEDLANRELVVLEAEARGYGARPEVVDKVASIQDDLVESKLYREYVVKDVTVSDDDAKAYFESNRARFVDEAQYELAQVLVDTREAAEEVERKVASRQPFAELAASYSKDRRNAADGGSVGFVTKGLLKDEFAPVAALAEGAVSAPLEAADGWHVVKVLSIRPERQRTFDEVKDQARKGALEERRKVEVDRWVATLRKAGKIEISDRGIRAYGRQARAELAREQQARQEAKRAAAAKSPAAAPAASAPAGAQPATDAPPAAPALAPTGAGQRAADGPQP